MLKPKIPTGGVLLGHLLSVSGDQIWAFLCYLNSCALLSSQMSELQGFSLNFIWLMKLLAISHKGWRESGEGDSREMLRSREGAVVVRVTPSG